MNAPSSSSFISRRSLIGACAGITGLTLAGTGMAAQTQGRIRLAGWSKPISEITNILVEPEKGFFKAQGVELAYLPGAGGGDAIRNMLSGQGDVAFTDPGSFFMALDKGEKLVAIYDIYPQNVFNVVSLKSANIHKPADLKGKKIGVYSLSSGTRQNLLVMLHQAGLKESDVTIVVTGLLNFAPLMQGQVDATAATDTGLAVGLRKGMGDINLMKVSEHLNISSDMFVVREDVLRQKKDLLKAFLKGYRDSAAWMIANPQEAAALAGKYAIDGTQRDINLDVIQLRNASALPAAQVAGRAPQLGSFDLAALQKGADTYRALGMIQRQIKVTDVVDTSLLPGA
ncbi:ABC transporter substrate-binding protein [Diaphorobacter caeni]|uniref:ABC transporter substrate-binding protein n=1 Tax=Diaphorobacter caeni TaxID=2784387 RepID=UPI00188E821D|nr:ABC transporter substrate-binding protein [Diaphorobacter caeni]MBF5004436.1 ABC transporter substrate-binding protein [Diaphorobacter caeni]